MMPTLIYSIDKLQSAQDGCLAIKIEEADKDSTSYFNPVKPTRPLTRSVLQKLALDSDKNLLDFLISEENRYQRKISGRAPNDATHPYHLVRIAYPQTEQALKLLAVTGRLHFNGRPIVIDLFAKTEFYFFVKRNTLLQPEIVGHIKTDDSTFDVRECDFVCGGPPQWFIKGIVLKFIASDISWKDIKRAYMNEDLHYILDDYEDDLGALVFADQNQKQKCLSEPLPVLLLQDRMGAFADLWMAYDKEKIPFHDSQAKLSSITRNPAAETAWEKDLLETDFIKKIVGTSHYYCSVDKVSKGLTFLLELGWHIYDSKGNRVCKQSGTNFNLATTKDAIIAKGSIQYDTFHANINEVIGSFNRKERFVQIGSGVVGLLPPNLDSIGLSDFANEGEIIADTIQVPRNRLGLISDFLDKNPAASMDAALQKLREQIPTIAGIKAVSPDAAFQGQLRPYQLEGLAWLSALYEYGFHGILADDMGLGKTVQVIAFLSRLKIEAPILIVMPTSLLFNWKYEAKRFLPHLPIYTHHGTMRRKNSEDWPKDALILTTYATLRIDLASFKSLEFQAIFLDEAQTIKNPNSQIAQAIFSLQGNFRLSITGTPIENHLLELWSHFRFLMPGLLGQENEFTSETQAVSSDSRYLQRIKKKIKPFILRRTKDQVAKDLPERIEQTVWVEMHPEQRKMYDDFLAGIRGNLFKKVSVDGVAKHRMEVFEAILRLRQLCCHPLLISAQEELPLTSCAKMEALLQDMETVLDEGGKALVYSQFTSVLKLIAKACRERNWAFSYLDGSTTNREKVVQQFQEDASVPFFLISLKAGGIGLNLTAADYVFLYDPWWNDAVENQAIDRAHRIGRQSHVIAKRFITLESIEEKMMKLKAMKQNLIKDLIDDELAAPSLFLDDLEFLLS